MDVDQHGAQPFQYLFVNPYIDVHCQTLFQALLLDPSIPLQVGGSATMHSKLVFQILTNHRLPVFIGFRFIMTVHIVNLQSHFVHFTLEAKALHPFIDWPSSYKYWL